jgi:hypothetical protein
MNISYEGWEVVIEDNLLTVTKEGETREYTLPEHTKIEQESEYIFVSLYNGNFIQYKMEDDDFFVGDLFTSDGEFIESVASHVFGEEEE